VSPVTITSTSSTFSEQKEVLAFFLSLQQGKLQHKTHLLLVTSQPTFVMSSIESDTRYNREDMSITSFQDNTMVSSPSSQKHPLYGSPKPSSQYRMTSLPKDSEDNPLLLHDATEQCLCLTTPSQAQLHDLLPMLFPTTPFQDYYPQLIAICHGNPTNLQILATFPTEHIFDMLFEFMNNSEHVTGLASLGERGGDYQLPSTYMTNHSTSSTSLSWQEEQAQFAQVSMASSIIRRSLLDQQLDRLSYPYICFLYTLSQFPTSFLLVWD
jgi:hypothetical protein